MEESDGAVIAGSLETPGAFGVIFDRHGSTLLRFLARRVDPAEAEDLLGEVFRIAFERRSAFERDRDSARPWLYGIAANLVAKHHRSEARRFRAMARVSARRLLDEDPAERAVAAARRRRPVGPGHGRHRDTSRGRTAGPPALRLGGAELRRDSLGPRRPGGDGALPPQPGPGPAGAH